jgi:hypothetical protein
MISLLAILILIGTTIRGDSSRAEHRSIAQPGRSWRKFGVSLLLPASWTDTNHIIKRQEGSLALFNRGIHKTIGSGVRHHEQALEKKGIKVVKVAQSEFQTDSDISGLKIIYRESYPRSPGVSESINYYFLHRRGELLQLKAYASTTRPGKERNEEMIQHIVINTLALEGI